MKSSLIRAALAATAGGAVIAAAPAIAQAQTVRGAVVHHDARAHSFTVADRSGHLFAIHARRSPRLGTEVAVTVKKLRDGTFRLSRDHVSHSRAHKVRIHGVVSWINRRTGEFTVSAPGVSMLVRGRAHRVAAASDGPLAVGDEVTATGTLDDQGDLEDQAVQITGIDTGGVNLEGTILSVDSSAGTITVSSDDDDHSGNSIVVTVPSNFDIGSYAPGQEVELLVSLTGTGTATLLGSAQDENAQVANDQGDEQGQDPGEQGDNEQSSQSSESESSTSGSSETSSTQTSSETSTTHSGATSDR